MSKVKTFLGIFSAALLVLISVADLQAADSTPEPLFQMTFTLKGLTPASEDWRLSEAELPAARINQSYQFDFSTLLSGSHQNGFSWSASNIPAWASLDPATGSLSGIPLAEHINPAHRFKVLAIRGDTSEEQSYDIEVAGERMSVLDVAVGGWVSCALTLERGVKCWGSAGVALGRGGDTSVPAHIPHDVVGLTSGVRSIYAEMQHACAITMTGALKCWGVSNTSGRLGNGTASSSAVPVDVVGMGSGVTHVGLGGSSGCAVQNGRAKCWGHNGNGQLGNGTTTASFVPVQVSGLTSGVVQVDIGTTHACALLSSGSVKCWGNGNDGKLGNNESRQYLTAVSVMNLTDAAQLQVSSNSSCALTRAGVVKCWGKNDKGQLGVGGISNRDQPTQVLSLSAVKSFAMGGAYACAVDSFGRTWCWGMGANGRTGFNDNADRDRPALVPGVPVHAVAVKTGSFTACSVMSDKSAYCWGYNRYGETGGQTNIPQTQAIPVLAP